MDPCGEFVVVKKYVVPQGLRRSPSGVLVHEAASGTRLQSALGVETPASMAIQRRRQLSAITAMVPEP